MPLSEREQRMLRELEEQLQTDDPGFASSLQDNTVGKLNARTLILGLLVTIAGVVVLVLGIYNQSVLLGIGGFVVMGAGVYFATSTGGKTKSGSKRSGNGGSPGSGGGGGSKSPQSGPSGGSFMSNLEEKWEKRRQDG